MAKILVVEDNELNRELVVDLLQGEHELLTARTAVLGMELARCEIPDLILMDLALPGMDGEQATRLLKKDPATSAIPIIILSVHVLKEDRLRLLEAGAIRYLTKPLRLKSLQSVIREVLE